MDAAADNAPHFPDLLLWAVPAFIICVILEYWLLARARSRSDYNLKDGMASIAMGLGMTISDIAMGALTFGAMIWIWQFRLFELGYSLPIIITAFILGDFVYYWKHRIYHSMRWWWMAHIVHHSSEEYNLTTALRQPWTNHITGEFIIKWPLIFLGFHPLLLVFVGALNLLYQFWIHTETINKCPKWVEAIMNTPSHHRVHHGRNPQYLDSNFAGTFIIWDRLFGTFVPENENDPPDYGIVSPIKTYNPLKLAFGELMSIVRDISQSGLTPRQRAAYLFGPPGYSHDGSRKTSRQIQAQARIKR